MPEKFDLLLTSPRRVRRIRWGLLAYVGALLGLLALRSPLAFGMFALVLPLQAVLMLFSDKLLRQPGWALLTADGITWAGPANPAPVYYSFADISAYRFAPSRYGIGLLLWLRNGEKADLSGSFTEEFGRLRKAFDQAVRRYNQAHPGTDLAPAKYALTRFFEHPVSTRVLWGLLAAAAALLGWGATHDWAPAAYLLPCLVLVPYLAAWANFYYERLSP